MTSSDSETAGMIAALVVTLDQQFPGFLESFDQNAAHVRQTMCIRVGLEPDEGDALAWAAELARLVKENRGTNVG